MTVVKMHLPIPDGALDDAHNLYSVAGGLRYLTEQLTARKLAPRYEGGLFGGEWGYGVEFENATFRLHPYCWCDENDCRWCSGDEPNFWYKPTGFKVSWYKYIGRGMEQQNPANTAWTVVLDACLLSIGDTELA